LALKRYRNDAYCKKIAPGITFFIKIYDDIFPVVPGYLPGILPSPHLMGFPDHYAMNKTINE